MKKFKVFVTRKIPETGINLLRWNNCIVDVYDKDRPVTKKILLDKIQNVDAVLTLLSDEFELCSRI